MPSSRSRQASLAQLIERPFAHRGLHGHGRIENSRSAFAAAIAAGHGIELDVQLSADHEAIVFHDYVLDRLTERAGRIDSLNAAELGQLALKGSADRIGTLPEVLSLIGGQAPLLIEVKSPGRRVDALSGAVLRAVRDYIGPVAVMSFNPQIGAWFARHAPDVLRGLVVTEAGEPRRRRLARRFALWRSRPDFLAYDVRDLPSRFAARQRARALPILTWTCRTAEQRAIAASHADQIIYEESP